jgi:hypothetical protein
MPTYRYSGKIRSDNMFLRIAIASVLLLLASTANPQNLPSEEPYWTPDAAMIAKLEAEIKIFALPKQATYPVTQFDRYYAGVTIKGGREIRGRLILPPDREDSPKTGIHITDVKYLPQLRGGGCANVYVTYYVDKDFTSAQCDLTQVAVPASEQPHWLPDEHIAARLEFAIQDFLNRTHGGLPDLSQYSRYYWGATVGGNQIIRGRVLMLSARDAGMHLADNGDGSAVMSDGGCNNIQIAYDVKAASLTRCACDGELQMPLGKIPLN